MNYNETLNWMFNKLPMYQRIGASAYKADLNNTIEIINYLDNPQDSFKSIHTARLFESPKAVTTAALTV